MNKSEYDVLDFADAVGKSFCPWQAKISMLIQRAATVMRVKLALRAPNGVGKSERVVALNALFWLASNPKARVRIVSYDSRQIADQVWPSITAHKLRFPSWTFRDHEKTIITPEGGRLRALATDDGGRLEGEHADVDSPLLILADEATNRLSQN